MARLISVTVIVILCLISVTNTTVQTVNGKLKITVGTTSGCPHTVTFINTLASVYEHYKENLELEFVPWGRTTRNQNGNLVCQFGNNDCFSNRLQRCVLDMLKGNQDAQMHYMHCEFSVRAAFYNRSFLCAQAVGLNLVEVDYCMSTTGDALEDPANQITIQPLAVINKIPFIVFNDEVNYDNDLQARTRLNSTICFALADDPATGVTHCKL